MNWTTILIVAVILTAFLMFSKGGQIPATDVAACLKTGALARAHLDTVLIIMRPKRSAGVLACGLERRLAGESSGRSVLAARRCRNPQPCTAAPQEQCQDAPRWRCPAKK
jgi:hypothetical protein